MNRWYQDAALKAMWDYYIDGNQGNQIVALPTGTGKSRVIAEWNMRVFNAYPNTRFLNLTHVKELVKQNAAELLDLWPNAPVGICSAGLRRFNTTLPIVFAGIQTAESRTTQLGYRDFVLVDECHLLSPSDTSRYQRLIKALKVINPNLKVIGLSATPYRERHHLLDEKDVFTDVSFDLCSKEGFNRLVREGFLVAPIARPTSTRLDAERCDLSNLSDQEWAFDKKEINWKCCEEIAHYGSNYQSWAVFCTGISHCEHVTEILKYMGVNVDCVHNKKGSKHNDKVIQDWKEGKIRAIVNRDMLTVGVNNPRCDFIAELRATSRPGLLVQIRGRSTRPFPGKSHSLILDFAGNTERCGPINDPFIVAKRTGKGRTGEMPVRVCGACGCYCSLRAVSCEACGFVFPVNSKLSSEASALPVVRGDSAPELITHKVHHTVYKAHMKQGRIPSLAVTYHCGDKGIQPFRRWVCFEHPGFAGKNARNWWRQRSNAPVPGTVNEALGFIQEIGLLQPAEIIVEIGGQYPEIKEEIFNA